jgi:NTP pyrophosphatase (non-canonical NTP hydrolase)
MKTLEEIQVEHKKWVDHNFWDHTYENPFFGIVEEVGELSHALLKRKQSIRVNEDHMAMIKDACGDITLFLMDFCRFFGFELSEALDETWQQVSKRDWIKYPVDGVSK